MPPTRTTAATVLERFPDQWHVIVELSGASEDFRELCQHHSECEAALESIRAAATPDADRIAEYEGVVKGLEQEIRRIIGEG